VRGSLVCYEREFVKLFYCVASLESFNCKQGNNYCKEGEISLSGGLTFDLMVTLSPEAYRVWEREPNKKVDGEEKGSRFVWIEKVTLFPFRYLFSDFFHRN
jgi:hypothetical protein